MKFDWNNKFYHFWYLLADINSIFILKLILSMIRLPLVPLAITIWQSIILVINLIHLDIAIGDWILTETILNKLFIFLLSWLWHPCLPISAPTIFPFIIRTATLAALFTHHKLWQFLRYLLSYRSHSIKTLHLYYLLYLPIFTHELLLLWFLPTIIITPLQ